ncbi:hypothetical protein OH784_29075 [Ectobacillus funiculus]|uniref:hypothetical protein n=1 Tax=Ectobacillus funiculus TaxID=137993 RepID=UPI00397881B3
MFLTACGEGGTDEKASTEKKPAAKSDESVIITFWDENTGSACTPVCLSRHFKNNILRR